jgi:hypothetical protein
VLAHLSGVVGLAEVVDGAGMPVPGLPPFGEVGGEVVTGRGIGVDGLTITCEPGVATGGPPPRGTVKAEKRREETATTTSIVGTK